ncbi:hypothetical protein LMG22037_05479 [Paraburkholderia phenoliruptrix]|uniref:Uncharacterized protein n=2 Tax=Paraburkholderia phenoliruptrix TaxID=252970 RepID=A0A6J5CAR8_9BURK|nr:hypothetical protein LMG22037_05479 [Paraburkholderia phenoliruptrix]
MRNVVKTWDFYCDNGRADRNLVPFVQELNRLRHVIACASPLPRVAATVANDDLSLVRELQKALFYWMPAIAGEDSPAGQKAAEHAYLLIGFDGNSLDCYGDQMRSSLGIVNRELERIGIACADAGCPDEMEVADFIADLHARAVAPSTADFKWPPLPAFPESFAHVAGHAYFTEHQMQGYANAYGEAVRALLAASNGEKK